MEAPWDGRNDAIMSVIDVGSLFVRRIAASPADDELHQCEVAFAAAHTAYRSWL